MIQHFCQLTILLCLLLGSVWQVVTTVCKEHAAFTFLWMWSSIFLWNTRLYGVITHGVTALPWKLQILFWITLPVSFLFVMWQAGVYCDCIQLIHMHGRSLVVRAHFIQEYYLHQPWDFLPWTQYGGIFLSLSLYLKLYFMLGMLVLVPILCLLHVIMWLELPCSEIWLHTFRNQILKIFARQFIRRWHLFFIISFMNCRYCSKCTHHHSTQWLWLWSFCDANPQWCGSASSCVSAMLWGSCQWVSILYPSYSTYQKKLPQQ